nr:hypothetical protein [uncultured Prevotella sp.]
MFKVKNVICLFVVCTIASCYWGNACTYYLKDRDLTFKIIEKDSFSILVLDDTDSIFMPKRLNGHFLGVEFFIPNDSDIVYFKIGRSVPIVYKWVENKYKIKFVQFDNYRDGVYDDISHMVFKNAGNKFINPYQENEEYSKLTGELSFDDNYWGFYGGCDQGRYTFGVMRGNKDYGLLEPLEWK